MLKIESRSNSKKLAKWSRAALAASALTALLTGSASATTWYVNGSAAAGGTGTSPTSPLNSLVTLQLLSASGDTIMIQPSTTPLNGGIALLPGQKLIGMGPPVLKMNPALVADGPQVPGSAGLTSAPTITNTTNYLNGDAVDMADNTVVQNLIITGTLRGGIYAEDSHNIQVIGNDLSAINSSATPSFRVQPFCIAEYTAGAPAFCLNGLPDGFAAIQVDGLGGQSNVLIQKNYIHNGTCNDGINIRSMNQADIVAKVDGNYVTSLVQCASLSAQNDIGTQVLGQGRLKVDLSNNTEANSGSANADHEGLFINPAEDGTLIQTIENNVYMNGIGGSSTNGMEYIVGNGAPRVDVTVSNSYFANDPGDMLELFNRGARGSKASLTLNNVTVQNTTISGGLPSYGNPPGKAVVSDNTGECLGISSSGADDVTILTMNNSSFSGCGNNGIEVTNTHVAALGTDNPHSVSLSINNSTISGSKYYNLWFNGVTPLTDLSVSVQNSNLSVSQSGVAVAFDQQQPGSTKNYAIDLGGGSLGSNGKNCIFGGLIYNLEATNYNVSAQNNWWGQASGPLAGSVHETNPGFTIDTSSFLKKAPPACS
jgi:hypothetical protein